MKNRMAISLLSTPWSPVYGTMVRHRDRLQIALVRWFARSHWSCRYSESLGCQLINKRGSDWAYGPYPSLDSIIWSVSRYHCCKPCSFHSSALAVQCSGAIYTLQPQYRPFPSSDVCPISSHSSSHPRKSSHGVSLVYVHD